MTASTRLVVCPHLIAEVRDVVARPKIAERIDVEAAAEFLAVLPAAASNVPTRSLAPA